MLLIGLDQFFRGNFYSKVHDFVTVVSENDLDKVFADVMYVSLNCRKHNLAARSRVGLLHELFQVVDGGLHGFG